jgi:hypothetical protein
MMVLNISFRFQVSSISEKELQCINVNFCGGAGSACITTGTFHPSAVDSVYNLLAYGLVDFAAYTVTYRGPSFPLDCQQFVSDSQSTSTYMLIIHIILWRY